MRKPRPDSKISQLTDEQQAMVADWLEKESCKAVAERIYQYFNLKVSSEAVRCFYQRLCSSRLLLRVAESATQADEFAEALHRSNPKWDSAIMGAIKQKIFDEAAVGNLDADSMGSLLATFAKLRGQDIRMEALKLIERKVVLQEASLKATQAVEEKSKAINLTQEQTNEILEAINKKLLGM